MAKNDLEVDINIILDNDREWRARILKELDDIQEDQQKMLVEMTTLKVKVAIFSGLISAIVSFVAGRI